MKRIVATIGLLGALTACTAPAVTTARTTFHSEALPASSTCPADGAVYPFGSCDLAPDVLPAPTSMHVEAGAPTKACEFEGIKFECPAGYTVPAAGSATLGE